MPGLAVLEKAHEKLKKYNTVEAVKTILDSWSDLDENYENIRSQLYAIVANEDSNEPIYSEELYKDIYVILLLFTKRWPRNNDEIEGSDKIYLCPLSRVKLVVPVCTAWGYQYEMDQIPGLLNYGKHPTDRQPFLKRDLNYLNAKSFDILQANQTFNRRSEFAAAFIVYWLLGFSFFSVFCAPLIVLSPILAYTSSTLVISLIVSIGSYFNANTIYPPLCDKDNNEYIANAESLLTEFDKEVRPSSSAVIMAGLGASNTMRVVEQPTLSQQAGPQATLSIEPRREEVPSSLALPLRP